MTTFDCGCGQTVAPRRTPEGLRVAGTNANRINDRDDYGVVTTSYGNAPPLWKWSVQRKSRPLGIHLHELGFRSEQLARHAGEQALAALLEGIRREERVEVARRECPPAGSEGLADAENSHDTHTGAGRDTSLLRLRKTNASDRD